MSPPLVEARDLVKAYRTRGPFARERRTVRAVDGVSLDLAEGETVGLVGESGCGKSTLGRLLLRLDEPTAGTVRFEGVDLGAADRPTLRALRRRMQIIFQDPFSSLDPRLPVGDSVAEGLEIHRLARGEALRERVAALLTEVGLDPRDAGRYPHEFSGGQRQRIGIARALAVEPAFVVCDEPVSALDMSVRAQVLALLRRLQADRRLALLFIAHDLASVRQLAHRVAVMYLGRIVEEAPADAVVARPLHPYTRALLSAVPDPDPARARGRIILPGEPPRPGATLPACPFAPRCYHPAKDDRCLAERPVLRELQGARVACHHAALTPVPLAAGGAG